MGRNTDTFTQMGGEGVSWIGQSHFTDTKHVFVNLGDGTYFHSGVLAIRASIAAKVNITYKILYNDAVAMTGGQPHDGELRVDMIAAQVLAEGVARLVVVMDDINKYHNTLNFPAQADIRHRDDMDSIQRELRGITGVTCIIYDQTCATELRRKRKRGLLPDPGRRVFVNDLVCEGCGDCSVQSNCISVEPKQTWLGEKRQINQTTCNKDMSCVKGFCPSFVTVEGGRLRSKSTLDVDIVAIGESLPLPEIPSLETPWSVLVTGVGGTGVVTVGALMLMAAFIEGKSATTLDQTGLAQKGGSVYSHIRLASCGKKLHAVRISDANANALIACDLVAASSEQTCLSKLNANKTRVVINTNVMPTSAFVLGKKLPDEKQKIVDLIESRSSEINLVDCYTITQKILGSTTTANIFMLGYAYQKGCVPLTVKALYQAIELNGVAVDDNKKAFSAGRLAAGDVARLRQLVGEKLKIKNRNDESLDTIITRRKEFLVNYQNAEYAKKYVDLVSTVRIKEYALSGKKDSGDYSLSKVVARYAFKLMAYKDEYEVARLYTNGDFKKQIESIFEGDYKLTFNLAPPLLSPPDKVTGLAKKMCFGGWMYAAFKVLAKLRVLRATPLDIFGYTAERKKERQLINTYQATVEQLLAQLTHENVLLACQIASLPDDIRGYGHIKARSIKEVEGKWQAMLACYRRGELSYTDKNIVKAMLFPPEQLPG
jgi:indolepyruvate ferredoxin oxidoreductase